MSAENVVVLPSTIVVTTPVTVRPVESVSSFSTVARVISVRLSCAASAGRTTAHSESAFAPTRQGNPSMRSQRMQRDSGVARPCSSWVRSTPTGRWKGCSPS